MKSRTDQEANYKSVFFNGKTIRSRIDTSKPILSPKNPEIEDVSLNTLCHANCPYCYASADGGGVNFKDIVWKAIKVWGSLPLSERPYQIAIGGSGEPTLHPQFIQFLEAVHALGITPNYTTNGMHLSKEILSATYRYCGGVAVSYHPNLGIKTFEAAIKQFYSDGFISNAHIVIGTEQSLDDFKILHDKFKKYTDYIVLLPYEPVGRAKEIHTSKVWEHLFEFVKLLPDNERRQLAFGAGFYQYVLNSNIEIGLSLYDPEIFSGYRVMDETYDKLRVSSFNPVFKEE